MALRVHVCVLTVVFNYVSFHNLHGAVFICVVAHLKQQLVWLKMHTDVTDVLQCLSCKITYTGNPVVVRQMIPLYWCFVFCLNQF